MSTKSAGEWLFSQNSFQKNEKGTREARTIAVTSGKGGVGKSSIALKMAKILASRKRKVLLIDCDHNLSNIVVKLGLPINSDFYNFSMAQKSYEDCLYKDGDFHLLSGCNGDIGLFESETRLDSVIIDVLLKAEKQYDYIILDCPAGLDRTSLTLNAYVDYRLVVVTPDKSSLTDSYSLMKILKNKYGVTSNHLLVNKVSCHSQYTRIIKSLSETTENFLRCRLTIFGNTPLFQGKTDRFDSYLLEEENSALHENLTKAVERFTEESCADSLPGVVRHIPGKQVGQRDKMFLQS